jgi:hypothetical protein
LSELKVYISASLSQRFIAYTQHLVHDLLAQQSLSYSTISAMNPVSRESKPSLDSVSTYGLPRNLVHERYRDLLVEQESMPDKVFISGYSLRELDPNLVVLDEETNEHPRVSRPAIGPLCRPI